MPRPTKQKQTEKDMRDDARARSVAVMRLLKIARDQVEADAPKEIILWSIGEAEAAFRKEARVRIAQ